jgi:hypothetical protein
MPDLTRIALLGALLAALAAAPAAAKPAARTHLGVAPGDVVSLVPETSPIPPDTIVPLAFKLLPEGGAEAFTIPAGTVLVVTDVIATLPRGTTPPGRYVGGLCDTPCINERVPIQMDTAVDGFQKTISITGAVIFKTTPQLITLAGNQEDMGILVYGYLAKDK